MSHMIKTELEATLKHCNPLKLSVSSDCSLILGILKPEKWSLLLTIMPMYQLFGISWKFILFFNFILSLV